MREVVLRVPKRAAEDVLDRLLPIVPGGVREREQGRHVELAMRGDELPSLTEIAHAAGRWPHRISERQVADDWRERRLADYEPDPIAGRLIVRPDWAPAAPANMLDIVLSEAAAFGAGTHPTTRTCLELLLDLEPAGSFADLGCGTGVLAILAAKLGWAPVTALDIAPESVETAAENARANGATVQARIGDLAAEPPPPADGLAANVPAAIHARIAATLSDPLPGVALLSGFGAADADATLNAYAARGLRTERRLEPHRWVVALLRRE
jgi:ribosomal protein L11 methyltransferase